MRPIYQIYVEEQLIDLDPKTVIAITLQIADFASGDIINRKASFTNQIKAPATNNNIRIFEFANNPKSKSTFPYLKKMFKILSNGIQIMEGVVTIKSFDTYFNLHVYSLPKDLSFRISGLYLSDLDFGDSNIVWNASFINSKRASTSGWCAPVVQYGQMDSSLATLDIGAYYLPSVSYKDTITAIFANAGYTVSGDFYDNDEVFNKMVILYSRNSFPSVVVKLNDVLSTTMLQNDFVKDFIIKFGAFLRIVNNNIEIITTEEILNNKSNAVDWTLKRVKNKKDIVQFAWNGFAIKNNFIYEEPDNLPFASLKYTSGQDLDDANGYLTSNNENLPESTDLYTSIFARSNWIVNGVSGSIDALERVIDNAAHVVYCVTSSIWVATPTSFDFEVEPKDMLAILDDRSTAFTTTENAVTYNGTPRTDYKIARFNSHVTDNVFPSLAWRRVGSGLTGGPPFNGLLDLYYPSLQRILTAGVITTTHEYNLNDIDINSLDLTVPMFDDGNYYLINKVVSYVSGKTTRVELLQI